MSNELIKPSDSELEILNILWEKGACSVREIHEILSSSKDVGYTTTLKVMQRMNEKGLVDRETTGKVHLYKAVIKENETKKVLFDKFLSTAFGGSAAKLVMQAIDSGSTSKEELEEIRNYLNTIYKEK